MIETAVKKDIRELDLEGITVFFASHGQKPFRAKQVYEWLWRKSVSSFDDMTNLSLDTRRLLEENFIIKKVTIAKEQKSSDGTIKFAFRLFDGNMVEGVLIPQETRMTACISSQVGCSLTCKFCGTGKMDRIRNLSASEIYDQVAIIRDSAVEHYQLPLSNIVYMGMGEPLLNYKNVVRSTELVTAQVGLGMAQRRLTVSTAGISKMIRQLGDDEVKFNLALSLHAANDEKRSKIMPINDSNSLEVLAGALKYYHEKTGNKVTFEYIIFKDFNDKLEDAKELLAFCQQVPCKVNIIEYNPIDDGEFQRAADKNIMAFQRFLETNGIVTTVRRSRGKDIDAACGQLAGKLK